MIWRSATTSVTPVRMDLLHGAAFAGPATVPVAPPRISRPARRLPRMWFAAGWKARAIAEIFWTVVYARSALALLRTPARRSAITGFRISAHAAKFDP